ncbi:SDR family NAD(P)-dependent oxidoreductase [Planomicrobium sp. CPCC 101079]|uniref:SDR family NAD(P)-dependent oxidoreductase n=1 Tax=Planomicrobium sp. CPCC 101079 TaxID=2599618 RepID=UPI0011B3B43B|nr:SDR family NAD(P)-dependent oxidoreductase [Planomicrobium sp. CPCC 101079]TWT02440.1 SDR family oxidoreductase [Planomicrobium sp. CPCC 101079]
MRMQNEVAIVTGAASGIGQEVSVQFAKEGARVVLVDLNSCEKTIELLGGADYLECLGDIRDPDFVKAVVNRTIEKYDEVHVLVNNAGTCSRLDLEDMTLDMWERDLDTNLKATFLFTQAVIYPHMKEARYGRIVNISSVSGINGGVVSGGDEKNGRSGPAYAASKGGVIALTKWVAKEVGKYGITCNSVAPGATATAITAGVPYDTSNQVIDRMGEPSDIANAVLYFATKEASYTTSQILKVDGGVSIG